MLFRSVRRDEELQLPRDLAFATLPGLSNEIRARLDRVRPATLAQAGRIEGVTPTALTLLAAHARRAPKQPSQPRADRPASHPSLQENRA